ncbi:hypothetical protein SISNIDRAFT_464872 [Sistotremastrum niveocremeum HHB9708]|uniref:Uncharacterized protein n=1 Tax=Sistotremastrum niveocremeum HHB9708 TaxID=1314777 RepID=A0A164WNZ5_9AGAM|nr:hypothetical protein SISNIDRAFT_464872 [Sistotremastrum niveocremeum HHB9708]
MATRSKGKPRDDLPILHPSYPSPPQKPDESDAKNAPQQKWKRQAPAEEKHLIDEVIKMILDGKLANITPAHVLACSPTIRTSLVHYLRSQRVEVLNLNNVGPEEAKKLIVAEDSLPLREIDVIINNQIAAKAVVDDVRTQLVSADRSTSQTLGLVKDLPIRVGPITYYVQAQVVRESPVPLLLGLPFWALAQVHKDVYRDGFMTLTMTDPNDEETMVTVSTTARGSQPHPFYEENEEEPLREAPGPPLALFQEVESSSRTPYALRGLSVLSDPSLRQFFH